MRDKKALNFKKAVNHLYKLDVVSNTTELKNKSSILQESERSQKEITGKFNLNIGSTAQSWCKYIPSYQVLILIAYDVGIDVVL